MIPSVTLCWMSVPILAGCEGIVGFSDYRRDPKLKLGAVADAQRSVASLNASPLPRLRQSAQAVRGARLLASEFDRQ